jgi:cytochrome P450
MLNILLDQPEVVKGLLAADKDEVLEGYVTEMLRIDPPLQGIYREARANEAVGTTSVKAGDLIYLDITTANKNVSF